MEIQLEQNFTFYVSKYQELKYQQLQNLIYKKPVKYEEKHDYYINNLLMTVSYLYRSRTRAAVQGDRVA